jgi:hypothetical protein
MSKLIGAAEYRELLRRAVHGNPSKYRSKKTTVGDTTYHSKREAEYCEGLKLRQKAGDIFDLQLQRRFKLEIRGQLICTYIADASYLDSKGLLHVVDVKGGKGGKDKGTRTPEYRIKVKMMKAIYGIEVEEV